MNDQQKQECIVRQSTLKLVVEYCNLIKLPITMKATVGITNVLTDYCINGYSKEIGQRLDKIDEVIQSKFQEDGIVLK